MYRKALCDALLMPRWHGAPPEAFEALRGWGERLTPDQLFATSVDAQAFRSWYLALEWSEREDFPGQIEVIRVQANKR